jgi:hypothetical protein
MFKLLYFGLAVLLMPHTATAQTTPPPPTDFTASLPIEVGMLYYKTAGLNAPIKTWAQNSPVVKSTSNGFGSEAIVEQERQRLSQLYKKITTQKTFFYSTTLTLNPEQSGPDQLNFINLDPDSPILFEDLDRNYAVFVRNFGKYEALQAPFEFINPQAIANLLRQEQPMVRAEIVFKPVAADKTPLELSPGQPVLMMLADVAEINLVDTNNNVLAQKRYVGWQKGSDIKNLFGGSSPLSNNADDKAALPQTISPTKAPEKSLEKSP